MNADSDFPFEDLLQDHINERKIKQFRKRVNDKRSELNESGNS